MLTTTTESSAAFSTGAYSTTVSGLSCDSTYYFRAFATNAIGTASSSRLTFTTSACPGSSSGDGGGTAIVPVEPIPQDINHPLSFIVERVEPLSSKTQRLWVRLNADERSVRGYTLSVRSDLAFTSLENYANLVSFDVPNTVSRIYGRYYSTTGQPSSILSVDVPFSIQTSSPAQTPLNTPTSVVQTNILFHRNLSIGFTGSDVRLLQQFLNTHDSPVATRGNGSPGKETTYFGIYTRNALRRFQQAHAEAITGSQKTKFIAGMLDTLTRTYIMANSR